MGLGPEDVYTHTHVGSPLACAAALVVLDEVPRLLARVVEAGERFERGRLARRGLLRARPGDADEARERGVLVVPAGPGGSLISATPPLTITDEEIDEALERRRSGRSGRVRAAAPKPGSDLGGTAGAASRWIWRSALGRPLAIGSHDARRL